MNIYQGNIPTLLSTNAACAMEVRHTIIDQYLNKTNLGKVVTKIFQVLIQYFHFKRYIYTITMVCNVAQNDAMKFRKDLNAQVA